jgi:hypothetical protein
MYEIILGRGYGVPEMLRGEGSSVQEILRNWCTLNQEEFEGSS